MGDVDALVNNLHSMFTHIDKQVIKQVYLSCGRDSDQTVDKLLCMAPVETSKPAKPQPTSLPVPITPSPTISLPISFPPHPQDTFTFPTPAFTLVPPSPTNEDAVEQKRLENLKQELASEYQRLSEKQKQSLEAEKRLGDLRLLIAEQQESLRKEQDTLQDEKRKFDATKRALESHLSATIASMKEEVRKQEEERNRVEAERRAQEEQERQMQKAKRRAEKESRKAEEMRIRTEELIVVEQGRKEMEAMFLEKQEEFQHAMLDKDNQIKDLQKEMQILVLELEEAKNRDTVLDALNEKVSYLLDNAKHDVLIAIAEHLNPSQTE